MTKKDIHYLKYLAEQEEAKVISEAEQKLLDNFLKHEYDQAEWDEAQMGSKATMAANIYSRIKGVPPQHKFFRIYYKYAVAAAIALIVGLGVLLRPQANPEEFMLMKTSSVTDSLKLNDGTIVYLAANSTFKYPKKFSSSTRAVSLLKGNAFFNVAKDPDHPFIVSAAKLTTKVLGTSFHISLDNDQSSVTVITGKVSVAANQQLAILKPYEKVVLSANGLEKQTLSDLSLYNWYKKDMQLDTVSLDQVFALLNLKYGLSFNSKDKKVLNTRMTLYLKEGLSLQNVLDQINYITNLKFRQHGNNIVLND